MDESVQNGSVAAQVGAGHSISADFVRMVEKTLNISGRLPNTLFTLPMPMHLLVAIAVCAELSEDVMSSVWFICQ